MNKRGLIKYIFICITSIFSFYFLFKAAITGFGFVPMILSFIFAITIFMFYNMNKIKRFKFIYDVILLLLMIFTIGIFIYLIYCEIKCYFTANCGVDLNPLFAMIYPMFLFVMLLFGFEDIFNKTNKENDILTIVVSLLIILIHMRYYLEPNFIHRIIGEDDYLQYSCEYITQNYIYFIIMYVVVILHRRVNKVS